MPPRSVKMKRFIFGFQRRVWWPKWTPASSSSFMETTGMVSPFLRLSWWCAGRPRWKPGLSAEPPSTSVIPRFGGSGMLAHRSARHLLVASCVIRAWGPAGGVRVRAAGGGHGVPPAAARLVALRRDARGAVRERRPDPDRVPPRRHDRPARRRMRGRLLRPGDRRARRPGAPRPVDRPAEPPGVLRAPEAGDRAGEALQPWTDAGLLRPRPLQGRARHVGPYG